MATLKTKIKIRRDTAANLAEVRLEAGELAYATDTKKFAIGDGSTKFSELKDYGFEPDLSSFVSATKNASVSVAGTTKDTYTYNKTTIFAPNGLIMGGTAASAGLVTRGICGASTPNATTGACTKDHLYLNFDGGTTWNAASRAVIINADILGNDLGSGMYEYAAVRGDIVKAWVEAKNYLTSHQSIKTLNTNNTTAQTVNASEAITGSGTINLHKISKTGSAGDLTSGTIPNDRLPYRLKAYSSVSNVAKADDATEQGFYYVTSGDGKKPPFKQIETNTSSDTGSDYHIFTTAAYSSDWVHQLGFDCRSNDLFIRRKHNRIWQPWTSIVKFQPCTGDNGNTLGTITDNAIPRWDTTRNTTLQNSGVTIDDNNNVAIPGIITQGTTSADSTISSMNRFQTDLFVSGNGVAPNSPKVAGFYLGKSAGSDENRHMDIVSGGSVSYIDFNKASYGIDYSARIYVDVNNGLSKWVWSTSDKITDKRLLVEGIMEASTIKKTGGADTHVLLAGGGTQAVDDFAKKTDLDGFQAEDADLTAIAGLTGTSGFLKKTAANTWALDTGVITGSGTSGYIAKFNGTNSITNGPAFGSDTTKYLRNDGTWAAPPVNNGTLTMSTSGTGVSGSATFTANQSGNSTFTVTLDSSAAGNRAANKVVLAKAVGQIDSDKFTVTSAGTTKSTIQYNTTEGCLEFVFV